MHATDALHCHRQPEVRLKLNAVVHQRRHDLHRDGAGAATLRAEDFAEAPHADASRSCALANELIVWDGGVRKSIGGRGRAQRRLPLRPRLPA